MADTVSSRRVVAIAGHDPSGGAGLMADERAAARTGVELIPVATCRTRQTMDRAFGWEEDHGFEERLARVERLIDKQGADGWAIKIGMIGTRRNLLILKDFLNRLPAIPVVMDPVLATSSGLGLWEGDPAELLETAPHVSLVTPNLPELAQLTGYRECSTTEESTESAARLLDAGFSAVLVKGGHASGQPVDMLFIPSENPENGSTMETGPEPERSGALLSTVQKYVIPTDVHGSSSFLSRSIETVVFPGQRIPGSYRGTGCWLSTAIAAYLARGFDLVNAVASARHSLIDALNQAHRDGIRYVP